MASQRVYFDVTIHSQTAIPVGRVVCELWTLQSPHACKLFHSLCENGKFVDCRIDRVVKRSFIQSNKILHNYDENIAIVEDEIQHSTSLHDTSGLLSLSVPSDYNDCIQFSITTDSCSQLDKKQLVIGKLLKGMGVVKRCEYVPTESNSEISAFPIVITSCGVLDVDESDGITPHSSTDGDTYPEYVSDYSEDIQERIFASNQIRLTGNEYFKNEDYQNALMKYEKAFRYLAPGLCEYEDKLLLEKEEMIVLGNIAAVMYKQKEYRTVVEICNRIVEYEPDNSKARVRRGVSSFLTGDLDVAKQDLEHALKLVSPDSPDAKHNILPWLTKVYHAQELYRQQEKKNYSNMFSQ
jgi:cyclophilin family peptidyl-prolyl cis-trans isomerase